MVLDFPAAVQAAPVDCVLADEAHPNGLEALALGAQGGAPQVGGGFGVAGSLRRRGLHEQQHGEVGQRREGDARVGREEAREVAGAQVVDEAAGKARAVRCGREGRGYCCGVRVGFER